MVVQRCLQKDRKARIPDISAARFLMGEASGFLTVPAAVVAISPRRAVQWKAASVVAAATMVALAGVAFIHFREKAPASPELMRLEVLPPDKTMLQKFAVSPDGRKIAFYAVGADGAGSVWVRSFDSGESRRLAETGPSPSITWSPDSRFVAFPGGEALNKLMKVEASGGPPQTICEIKGFITGGSWNRDGVIIFGSWGGGTWRVSDKGGAASPVTTIDVSRQETGHSTPVFLPIESTFCICANRVSPRTWGSISARWTRRPSSRRRRAWSRRVSARFMRPRQSEYRVRAVPSRQRAAGSAFRFGETANGRRASTDRRPREEHLRVRVLRRLRQRHPRVPDWQRRSTELPPIDVVRPAGREPRRGCGARVRWLFWLSPMLHAWQLRGSRSSSVSSSIWLDELARNTRTPLTSARVGDANPVLVAGRRARGLCLGPFRPHRSL